MSIDCFVTGQWRDREDLFSSLKESDLSHYLNFIKLIPELECKAEFDSIKDVIDKLFNDIIFVRSGQGSIDISLYKNNKYQHLETKKGLEKYSGSTNNYVFELIEEFKIISETNNTKVIFITGSFYHHFKNHEKEYKVTVVPDKEDINPYFDTEGIIAVRNFFVGENKENRKSSFIRKINNKYTGIDFGTGKVSFGDSDNDCKVDVNNTLKTVENVINWLEKINKEGVEFI